MNSISPRSRSRRILQSSLSRRRLFLESLEDRRLMAYDLQILHASDMEAGLAAIADAPRFAAIVDAFDDMYANTLILSGGDNFLPGPFFNAGGDSSLNSVLGSASIGRADIEILSRIGVEASAIGNHEFDAGARELGNAFFPTYNSSQVLTWKGGQFPYLSANVNFVPEPDLNFSIANFPSGADQSLRATVQSGGREASTIKGRIAPTTVITEGSEKIGIIGLTTPEIITISSPGPNVVVTPASGQYDFAALSTVVNNSVDALRAQHPGLNKIILLSHLQQFQNEVTLAPLLRGVDIIIAAGSNTITADAGDRLRPGDVSVPAAVATSTEGTPILIVSTDGNYRYVGRMVVSFDANGVLEQFSPGVYMNPANTGAYAGDDQGVIDVTGAIDVPTAIAASAKATGVKQVTDAVAAVIAAKDGNLLGKTSVYLEGRRAIVRTQETNLGNLTADANIFAARQFEPTTTGFISLKNGGGIRDSIGSAAPNGSLLPPAANPAAGKQSGDISQLDIENALRFNNSLSLVSTSGAELARLLESGFALSGPGQTQGRFPQISGMSVEVDLTKPAGDRLRKLVATDVSGAQVNVVQNGIVVAPLVQFRMVTLDFLANGGDGYPFASLATPNRVNLTTLTRPAGLASTFATSGSEQDALAAYLRANFSVTPFGQAETPYRYDQRVRQYIPPNDAISLALISTTSASNGAEITAYDAGSQRLFVTRNDGLPSVQIVSIANPSAPTTVANINLSAYGREISSVDVKNGIVAATLIATPKINPGQVVFLDAVGTILGSVPVGAGPDMITFTPNGQKVLVANEGEAADNASPTANNPEGSVSIITLDTSNIAGGSLNSSSVATAGFAAFNSQKDALRTAGVRLLTNPGVTVAMDLEPEYIAIDPLNPDQARVTLQENNALGVLDLTTNTFASIQPLGLKDYSLIGNEFDASDRDGKGTGSSSLRIPGNLKNWPVKGVYMPDGIASFSVGGQTYYVTANEGDARANAADTADTDVTRVGSIATPFDPAVFDSAMVTFLRNEDNLGRLNVLTAPGDSDSNLDGKIDRLLSLGARSFSIWDSAGNRVFDSGSELERITFAQTPAMFNANNGISSDVDLRSDDKGPEPEGVTTGVVNGRTYAFVGLERAAGGVMVYDVTNPREPVFVQYVFKNDQNLSAAGDDVAPEGVLFIAAANSPQGKPLVVLSNEVSGTVTIYEVTTAPVINEFVFNHTGTDTNEFIEVFASPYASLSAYTLVVIEGDTATSGKGVGEIDVFIPLTTADAGGYWTTGFQQDLFENGTKTVLLVKNFTGALGDDLDTNNDGILDVAPWETVIDGIAVNDGNSSNDRTHSPTVLGNTFGGGTFAVGGASRIPNGNDSNVAANWLRNDFDGAGLSPAFVGTPRLGEAYNTPGAANVAVVPFALTIPQIQGAGHHSPYTNDPVQTTGIVTARSTNGFWIQTPTPADADLATSEGVFVFTSSAPTAAIVVGASVRVDANVKEFGFANALSITELVDPLIAILSTGNTLPAATVVGLGGRVPPTQVIDDDGLASFDPMTDGIDFFESLEGMLVQVNDAVAVSSNARFGEIAVLADAGVGAGPRTANGGIYITPTDFNPERIIIDDLLIAAEPDVTVGDRLNTVIGVMDYSFGNFKLLNTQPLSVAMPGGILKESTTLTGSATHLAVATFNVENLDGNDSSFKFAAVARDIVTGLGMPDIVALQEVQDNNGSINDGVTDASLTAAKLIDAIVLAGGPLYVYLDIAPENNMDGGEPGANIRPGFLFNPARVQYVAGSLAQIDPTNPAFLNSRKPLVAKFLYNGQQVTMVNNHFSSKSGDTPLFGSVQPPVLASEPARIAQAEVVRAYVDGLLNVNADDKIIVLGDLNDFEFSPPLEVLTDGGALTSLINTASVNDRYSFNFDGNSQVLDHILVSPALLARAQADFVHLNIDFPALTDTANERSSDHDPLVARLAMNGVVLHDGVLYVTGTEVKDKVMINMKGNGLLKVLADFLPSGAPFETFPLLQVQQVLVFLGDGDDHLKVTRNFDLPLLVDAGAGDDKIYGGGGRSVQIGGEGSDDLSGGGGDDLLIGGTTAFDGQAAALLAILREWSSANDYSTRVTNLRAGTGAILGGTVFRLQASGSDRTVFDDGDKDKLHGGKDRDWFFACLTGSNKDKVLGKKDNELLDELLG